MGKTLKLFNKIKLQIWVVFVGFIAVKLSGIEMIAPLVALCAGSGGGGGNGGGGDGGGGDVDPGGGVGCGCGMACACGGCVGNVPSTPFLCTWNGKKFVFENDFLFGKPSNYFQTVEEGRMAYENSFIEGDLYRIKNSIHLENKQPRFQIKEIEPEESFIDYLSLFHVLYPKEGELIVDSKFKDFFIFKREAIENGEGVESQTITSHNSKNIAHRMGSTIDSLENTKGINVYEMETGDTIQIKGNVNTGLTKPLFLLLGSHYRDWTLGEIFNVDHKDTLKGEILSMLSFGDKSPSMIFRNTTRVMMLVLILSVVWFMGAVQNPSKVTENKPLDRADHKKLATTFGVNVASADTPPPSRSLVIEYYDGVVFKKIDIVEPRYYQPSVDAISIPEEAILDNGEVTIRVSATKKHNVTSALLMSPKEFLPYKIEKLSVSKAFHNREKSDYAHVLNTDGSKQYLHTIPADVVDIEFETPNLKEDPSIQKEAYLVKAKGFYAAASEETQRTAGDWVNKLDPESHEWLKETYSLKDYSKDDREPVLS